MTGDVDGQRPLEQPTSSRPSRFVSARLNSAKLSCEVRPSSRSSRRARPSCSSATRTTSRRSSRIAAPAEELAGVPVGVVAVAGDVQVGHQEYGLRFRFDARDTVQIQPRDAAGLEVVVIDRDRRPPAAAARAAGAGAPPAGSDGRPAGAGCCPSGGNCIHTRCCQGLPVVPSSRTTLRLSSRPVRAYSKDGATKGHRWSSHGSLKTQPGARVHGFFAFLVEQLDTAFGDRPLVIDPSLDLQLVDHERRELGMNAETLAQLGRRVSARPQHTERPPSGAR